MELPSNVRFINNNLKEEFNRLLKRGDTRELYEAINKAIGELEQNAFSGIQIPKRLIPKGYIQNYDISNLWKYNLSSGWRLIYTIKRDQIIVVSLILEWLDHPNYERKFKY